ncbi:MAG: outer membrane lipoprotein-sorting protein [Deltaproteobacteria bacterium]|nr:outer membrane lipoprotein-sorting protein [Deltaproteobacteria bacterium]
MRKLSLLALCVPLLTAGPARADEEVKQLLHQVDELYRGSSSEATVQMHIKTANWERNMEMRVASQGTDQALVRILAPAKDKGTTTLRVGDNLWNYLPKVDRTIKVPAAMMSNSWMGSHFTNDDLVQESRLEKDYTSQITQRPSGKDGSYVIELVPKPNAPVVWGKVELTLGADKLPKEQRYFDEKGKLVRTLAYGDVKALGGRKLPSSLTVTPTDKPGEFTTLTYVDLNLDAHLPPETFSLQALRK